MGALCAFVPRTAICLVAKYHFSVDPKCNNGFHSSSSCAARHGSTINATHEYNSEEDRPKRLGQASRTAEGWDVHRTASILSFSTDVEKDYLINFILKNLWMKIYKHCMSQFCLTMANVAVSF